MNPKGKERTSRKSHMKNKKVPVRQCIGCGEMKHKKEMMRVLKDAEGNISLDVTGRKNGRGAYLCISEDCLLKAKKNRGLERSLRVRIPEQIYESLEEAYRNRDEQ